MKPHLNEFSNWLVTIVIASLVNHSYTIVSTGGTASALESSGLSVTKVEQLTCFPEMVSIRNSLSCFSIV